MGRNLTNAEVLSKLTSIDMRLEAMQAAVDTLVELKTRQMRFALSTANAGSHDDSCACRSTANHGSYKAGSQVQLLARTSEAPYGLNSLEELFEWRNLKTAETGSEGKDTEVGQNDKGGLCANCNDGVWKGEVHFSRHGNHRRAKA